MASLYDINQSGDIHLKNSQAHGSTSSSSCPRAHCTIEESIPASALLAVWCGALLFAAFAIPCSSKYH